MTKIIGPGTKAFNRRTLLKATAIAGAGLAAPALWRGAQAQEKVLYVNTWGGPWTTDEQEAFYKPFTAETGVEIRPVTPVSFAKLKASVVSKNYEFDVTCINTVEASQAKAEGLVEPIDWSVVDRAKIPQNMVFSDMGFAYINLGTHLCYRKDKFPNGGPKSWADFWDVKKFPGNRAFIDRPWFGVEAALMADGVPRDKLYPLDIPRAFKKLDELKPHIKVWWKEAAQSEQLVRDGEVDLTVLWSGRAITLQRQGIPLEVVWEGSELVPVVAFVPKGTPRAKMAWQYAAFMCRPDRMAEFTKRELYGPMDPRAFDYMDKDLARMMPTWPDHAKVSVSPDTTWLTSNMAKLRERWTQWLAG